MKEVEIGFTAKELDFLKSILEEYALPDKPMVMIICDKISKRLIESKKSPHCEYCNGTGWVQVAPNARGIKRCPYCNGNGKPSDYHSHDLGEDV